MMEEDAVCTTLMQDVGFLQLAKGGDGRLPQPAAQHE
jgi:hypothetical protein